MTLPTDAGIPTEPDDTRLSWPDPIVMAGPVPATTKRAQFSAFLWMPGTKAGYWG
jgi:hypothetical protein